MSHPHAGILVVLRVGNTGTVGRDHPMTERDETYRVMPPMPTIVDRWGKPIKVGAVVRHVVPDSEGVCRVGIVNDITRHGWVEFKFGPTAFRRVPALNLEVHG
jgi:hypothetical protein